MSESEKHPKQREFDIKREKNVSNRVFGQGKGKEQHREKERESKSKKGDAKKFSLMDEVMDYKKQDGLDKKKKYDKKEVFKEHITDKKKIKGLINRGNVFEGVFKKNPKFNQRGFVNVQTLNLDVLVDGQAFMNRAFDGDKVLIELEDAKTWEELPAKDKKEKPKQSESASETKKQPVDKDDKKPGLYSNNQAVETRLIDEVKNDKDVKSRNLDEIEECGTNDLVSKNDNENDYESAKSDQKSESINDLPEVDCDDSNDGSWEDVDSQDPYAFVGSEVDSAPSSARQEKKERTFSMAPPKKVLIKLAAPVKKPGEERDVPESLTGSSEERLVQINELCKTHRPRGKVLGILESPNREKDQLCTLVELESKPQKDNSQKNKGGKKTNKPKEDES